MENFEQNLKPLGIDGKDAEIYLALLRLKKATVIQLARITQIKRTTVYHCLDNLISKGVIRKSVENEKSYYIAEDPHACLDTLLEEKRRAIKRAIPELVGIFGTGLDYPDIKVYHNLSGAKKVLTDILTCKEKLCRYYLTGFSLEDYFGNEVVNEFVSKRINAGIHSKALRSFEYKPEREKESTHAKQLREVKFLPENVKMKTYICIYDNKVSGISSKEEKLGFIIESKEFADAQKAIFDMIWNTIAI